MKANAPAFVAATAALAKSQPFSRSMKTAQLRSN